MVGRIAKVGRSVKGFVEGDRVVADPGITVREFFCFDWVLTVLF